MTDLLEEYVCGLARHNEAILRELFERLRDLHRRGLDSIWARRQKRLLYVLLTTWSEWESLPQAYRDALPLWRE